MRQVIVYRDNQPQFIVQVPVDETADACMERMHETEDWLKRLDPNYSSDTLRGELIDCGFRVHVARGVYYMMGNPREPVVGTP